MRPISLLSSCVALTLFAGVADASQYDTTVLFQRGDWSVEHTYNTLEGNSWCAADTVNTAGQWFSVVAYDHGGAAIIRRRPALATVGARGSVPGRRRLFEMEHQRRREGRGRFGVPSRRSRCVGVHRPVDGGCRGRRLQRGGSTSRNVLVERVETGGAGAVRMLDADRRLRPVHSSVGSVLEANPRAASSERRDGRGTLLEKGVPKLGRE